MKQYIILKRHKMDTLTNAIKVFARNEWIYYYYAKIKSTFQKYIDDSFEANQIIDNLWLGAVSSSCNREALHEYKIETIISAFLGSVAEYPYDFDYERAKLRDVEDEDILQHFDYLLPIIHKNLMENKPVLICCQRGRSRSASIVAAYLIRYRNMTTDEALKFIKDKRTQINPNKGYIDQLRTFEASHVKIKND